jgi:hypothetical protein
MSTQENGGLHRDDLKQLNNRELSRCRKIYSAKQKYRCPICGDSIAAGRIALDHCHSTGRIRAVLCGTCNRNEGKVRKAAKFMVRPGHLVSDNYIQWLRNLANYLAHHKDNPSGLVHPSFDLKTGKQKPIKRPKKIKED